MIDTSFGLSEGDNHAPKPPIDHNRLRNHMGPKVHG
jgi:hypothetical protein